MLTNARVPDWIPRVPPNSKILIAGGSSGIGQSLVGLLCKGGRCTIGVHSCSSKAEIITENSSENTISYLQGDLRGDENCRKLVDEFVDESGGIDALVVLCGGISNSVHWKDLSEEDWKHDIDLNLSASFFLSRAAMGYMKNGGRIVLMGTESSLHGGGAESFAYGIAKHGIECLVHGLARDGAKNNILVNGIRPGFILSGFHQRWQHKSPDEIRERLKFIPLKRAGTPEEVAAFIIYLMSDWTSFVTGQMISVAGGDWL